MKKNVLVLAVHPDDETLGCGGSLLKHREQGDDIHWLIASGMSEAAGFTQGQKEKRSLEINKVVELYGFQTVHQLNFPPTRLDQIPVLDLIEGFSKVINQVHPTDIYLPFPFDVHSDHRAAFQAIFSCTKAFRYHSIRRIYAMETLTETEFAPSFPGQSFVPNCFVDISTHLDKKLEIMACYQSELGEHPFPRSIETIRALAMVRGATAHCQYAEAFMLLKEIR